MNELKPSARSFIEPAALDDWRSERIAAGDNTVSDSLTDYEVEASVAISLRRLADVAETVAAFLWNYDPDRDPRGNTRTPDPSITGERA